MNQRPWINHYDEGVPEKLEYPQIPLYEYLRRAARKYPRRAGVIFQDTPIEYRTLDRLSDALARGMVAAGVAKGEPVGLLMPNIPQFVIAYYAILKAGGVVVAINPLYKQRELEFQIRSSDVRVLFALTGSVDLIRSLAPEVQPRLLITTEEKDAIRVVNWLSGEGSALSEVADITAVLRDGEVTLADLTTYFAGDDAPLPSVQPGDPAIFQYTGGTTGTPKAAVGLHRNLVANTVQFRAWLESLGDGDEVFLTAIPLYHVYGMVIGMSVGVAMGATLVLIPAARNIAAILQNIQKYHATFFPGVPSLYQAINHDPDVMAGKYNLRSIKACISGSAPLLLPIKERFEALTGGKLVEGYGLSEAPTATHCNPINGENRAGSIGLPLPDVDARIVDLETGRKILPPGDIGELVVRGPQVMAEYYHMPEETAETLRGGWLSTGDIARMDDEGYFYIVDRKKELIKIGGFQVWPREVEEVIAQHPAVLEVGVAGVPDVERGEAVKAWIVVRPGMHVTAEAIRDWCTAQLARYKVPTLVEFRGPLPRTTVGKILRRELIRLHRENML